LEFGGNGPCEKKIEILEKVCDDFFDDSGLKFA
jgi:hypothetical protein